MNDIITDYFEADKYRGQINTVTFKKGEVILRPYDDTRNIYAISEGLLKIYNVDSDDKEYIAVIYGRGDFYPLAWLINQERPPIYFQAITKSKVHIVSRDVFQKHLSEDVNLSSSFTRRVIEQFAYYATTVNNLGLKHNRKRLCYMLLVLAAKFGEKKNELVTIPHISHSDLGATTHMTRESVNREVTELEKLGVLEYSRANIIIKDTKYLQKELGENVTVAFFADF
jgi:CRP-like cAMP-binding protein